MNKDAAKLAKAFAKIPRAVRDQLEPAIEKGADELVGRMSYLAPDETGELAASIKKSPAGDLAVTVETDNDAALYQEYGTAKMERNSFFWPSVNTLKKRIRRRMDRAVSKGIKKEWGR